MVFLDSFCPVSFEIAWWGRYHEKTVWLVFSVDG
jgi:hypothetical protein